MDIFWCKRCNTPLLELECDICGHQGYRIAADIRPVFPEEKQLIEVLLEYDSGYLDQRSVWGTNGGNIIIDGKTLAFNKGILMKNSPKGIGKKISTGSISAKAGQYFRETMSTFVKANDLRLNIIELEAFDIIRKARSGRSEHISVVSFSGGKDSIVISDLVRRAYASQSILHIFGDTTLELPETYTYISEFKERYSKTPFLESKSRHDFMELCKQIGPPSRIMRWCCTVFKTGPIGQVFEGLSKTRPMLTYYGVRRSESNRRANYEAISSSPKVAQQTVVSPIIDWVDGDVWLYIFAKNLDVNHAYKLGFSRVGCWACPANSMWSFFLSRIYHSEFTEPWRSYLIETAFAMGKLDAEEYVDSGNWKKRQGGQGLKTAYKGILSSQPCGDDTNAKTYSLIRGISGALYEYFKPFGRVDYSSGRSLLGEVFVVDKKTNDPIMVIQGRTGMTELRVKVIDSNNPTLLLQRVDCQLRKYQSCVLCGGCPAVCPTGAISDSGGCYIIDEEKCVNCLKCISNFDTGCLVSKVLRTKRGTNV